MDASCICALAALLSKGCVLGSFGSDGDSDRGGGVGPRELVGVGGPAPSVE